MFSSNFGGRYANAPMTLPSTATARDERAAGLDALAHELGADRGELAAGEDVDRHAIPQVLAGADLRHADRFDGLPGPDDTAGPGVHVDGEAAVRGLDDAGELVPQFGAFDVQAEDPVRPVLDLLDDAFLAVFGQLVERRGPVERCVDRRELGLIVRRVERREYDHGGVR